MKSLFSIEKKDMLWWKTVNIDLPGIEVTNYVIHRISLDKRLSLLNSYAIRDPKNELQSSRINYIFIILKDTFGELSGDSDDEIFSRMLSFLGFEIYFITNGRAYIKSEDVKKVKNIAELARTLGLHKAFLLLSAKRRAKNSKEVR